MKKAFSIFTVLCLLGMFALFPAEARGAAVIKWGQVQTGTYENLHPHTLNWSGNVLDKGGLKLSTMKTTTKSSEADLVINQYGSIGANGILLLKDEELSDPTDSGQSGFTNSLTLTKGAVYLVVLHDGKYAKLRIDRFTPDNGASIQKVFFSFVLEAESEQPGQNAEPDENNAAPANQSGGSKGTLELGSPAEDMDLAVSSYVFMEGSITVPWNKLDGHTSWDLFRSDNGAPYVKMTDFRLDKTEFTDKYVLAGHIYLYKFVAYNAAGKAVYVSPPVKVSIVAADNVIVLQLNSTDALINGKAHQLNVAPFLLDGRTMVPLRFVSEALGAEVEWDGDKQKITLLLGDQTMILHVDSSEAIVDGKTIFMDVPATIVNGSTVVPIRFVGENFRQEITFDDATKTITIKGGGTENPSQSGADEEQAYGEDEREYEADAHLAYFLGEWSMWVPGTGLVSTDGSGRYVNGVDGGTLYIYEDGTFEHYNGSKKTTDGEWTIREQSGTLELTGYKWGWDWIVSQTDDGIKVSSYGVYETGSRAE